MQIIIDIDEWVIDWIRKDGDIPQNYYEQFQQAFINGVILLKGHGRLIDENEAIKSLFDYHKDKKTIGQCINDTPTVLEADKE